MTTVYHREVHRAAQDYRAQARARRAITPSDPVADALEFVAADLEERLAQLVEPGATRTIPEYAAERGVSVATVRRWIQKRKLRARRERGEWLIAATEEPLPDAEGQAA